MIWRLKTCFLYWRDFHEFLSFYSLPSRDFDGFQLFFEVDSRFFYDDFLSSLLRRSKSDFIENSRWSVLAKWRMCICSHGIQFECNVVIYFDQQTIFNLNLDGCAVLYEGKWWLKRGVGRKGLGMIWKSGWLLSWHNVKVLWMQRKFSLSWVEDDEVYRKKVTRKRDLRKFDGKQLE